MSLWLYVLVIISAYAANALNYVTPNGLSECLDDYGPCLTLEEYVTQQGRYFTNDSLFHFYPGIHFLNDSLTLSNVHNVTMQGFSSNGQKATVVVNDIFISINWKNCEYVQIYSIDIILAYTFDYVFGVYFSHFVQLSESNMHVLDDEASGCSLIEVQSSTINVIDSTFTGLEGYAGAVLTVHNSSVSFTGNNTFENNEASLGGVIYLTDSELDLKGTTIFKRNKSLKDNSRFVTPWWYRFTCNEYLPGSSGYGGAIFCNSSVVRTNEHTNFVNNKAEVSGGAISCTDATIVMKGYTTLDSNSAYLDGGAIKLSKSSIEIYGNIQIVNSTAAQGGALDAKQTTISINAVLMRENVYKVPQVALFAHNRAARGGSISCLSCDVSFAGIVHFVDNAACVGGAMVLSSASIHFMPSLQMSFIRNHADDVGGAIFVFDGRCLFYTSVTDCFFSIEGHNAISANVLLDFVNNSAGYRGSTLYGGQLNECRLWFTNASRGDQCGSSAYGHIDGGLETFMSISQIQLREKVLTNISSSAQDIKLCYSGSDATERSETKFLTYPGRKFNITLISVGQAGNGVRAKIVSVLESSLMMNFANNFYNTWEHNPDKYSSLLVLSQYADSSCSNVSFRLFAPESNSLEKFHLYADCQSKTAGLTLDIITLPCPLGFTLSEKYKACVCNDNLLKVTSDCYIDDFSIGRVRNNFWISKLDEDTIILHEFRCPLEYCRTDPVNVTLGVAHESVQCDFNRNGTLCGQCQGKYSLALGSLHCLQCSNQYITLILTFMLAGIFLIAIIFLLRLTVAMGTLSGLIFYVNVVQANHQAFFPRATLNFCTYFISWLNLDLGIEVCFYDGMDIYAYSWFQFCFPFYIWFLIGFIICASNYSKTFSKLLGHNPVAVLATLLLLSYSKLLKSIITPLSWTYLTFYNSTSDYRRKVWLYDGNVEFFKEPKHIVLGVFAILTIVLFVVPYILLLLCGHWMQGCSNWRALSWLNNLKPFMDAYYAPYKKHTRYWTGLLLVSRMGLYLTFAINALGNESINILAITSISAALLALKGRVYEHWFNDVLESVFLLDLCILSIATYYVKKDIDNSVEFESQVILSTISVSTAVVTFIGILLYHTVIRIKSTNMWKKKVIPQSQRCKLFSMIAEPRLINDSSVRNFQERLDPVTACVSHATSTVIDINLREPLIELKEEDRC